MDLSRREEIYETAEKVKKEVGDVDILINNAGIVTGKKLCDCPDNLIKLTMDVNVMSHFFVSVMFFWICILHFLVNMLLLLEVML